MSRIIASFYIHTKSRSFCVGNEVRDRNITGYLYSVGLKNQTSYSFIISPQLLALLSVTTIRSPLKLLTMLCVTHATDRSLIRL